MGGASPTRRSWGVVVGIGVGILVGSLLPVPNPDGHSLVRFADKVLHAVAYGVLSVGLGRAIVLDERLRMRMAPPRPLDGLLASHVAIGIVVIGITVAYGVGIEGLQLLVPGRQFEVADGLANGVGAILGVAMWTALPPDRTGRVSPSGGPLDPTE